MQKGFTMTIKTFISALILCIFTFTVQASDGKYIYDVDHAKELFFKQSPQTKQLPENMQKLMFEKLLGTLKGFSVVLKDKVITTNFDGETMTGTLKVVNETGGIIKYLATPNNPKPDQKPAYVTIQGNKLTFEFTEQTQESIKPFQFVKTSSE